MNKLKQKKGSFLLEVLLSVVILSISITLIIQAMTSSLRATQYSAEYVRALFFLENEMFDVICKVTISGTDEKDTGYPDDQYHISLTTERFVDEVFSDDKEFPFLSEWEALVSWRSGRKNNQLSLSGLRLDGGE